MKKGFTLIELLVVVLIIGILAAVALPKYEVAVFKSRVLSVFPLLRAIRLAEERYELANGTQTADIDNLDIDFPYTSKQVKSNEIWYINSKNNSSLVINTGGLIIWKRDGITIDFYGYRNTDSLALCYASRSDSLEEKVCAALGKKIAGRVSSAGTNVYQIKF